MFKSQIWFWYIITYDSLNTPIVGTIKFKKTNRTNGFITYNAKLRIGIVNTERCKERIVSI